MEQGYLSVRPIFTLIYLSETIRRMINIYSWMMDELGRSSRQDVNISSQEPFSLMAHYIAPDHSHVWGGMWTPHGNARVNASPDPLIINAINLFSISRGSIKRSWLWKYQYERQAASLCKLYFLYKSLYKSLTSARFCLKTSSFFIQSALLITHLVIARIRV